MYPYIITRESVTVTVDNAPHIIRKDAVNYRDLVAALLAEDESLIDRCLTLCGVVRNWFAKYPEIEVTGDGLKYRGAEIPSSISTRIHAMITAGEDPVVMIRFWERLSRNPSWRSVQQLYTFLQHNHIPLTEDGMILAYKAVRHDWMDFHSGEVENKLGAEPSMPRNQISDDPNEACHKGFHVGALAYAQSFGDDNRRMLVCEVDPENVVCVPYDCDAQKMRVCRYKVVGLVAAPMSSTVQKVEPEPEDDCSCGEPDCCICNDDGECDWDGDCDWDGCEDPEDDPTPHIFTPTFVADSDLEVMTLDQLRRYASGTLKMVGASKIPGGKLALLQRIRDLK
jgi:hypothetical protein